MVAVMITNHTTRPFSVVVGTEVMKDAAWQPSGYMFVARLLRRGESEAVVVAVPYEASRWLQIPMPPDADVVPWRVKVTRQRVLAGAEHVLAKGFEKLGFKYPFNSGSQQYLEFVP